MADARTPARGAQPALADLFPGDEAFERFLEGLGANGVVRDLVVPLDTPSGRRQVAISAALVHDDQDRPLYVDGLLVDVTELRDAAASQAALMERLQASLLFLHEPIASLSQEPLAVDMTASIRQVARQMSERQTTAALVSGENGPIVGIVTDQDLREHGRSPPIAPWTTRSTSS